MTVPFDCHTQRSHRMPEKTLADMLQMMKKGEVNDYIRSGSKMPDKHTEADRSLRAEVKIFAVKSVFYLLTINARPRPVFRFVCITVVLSATSIFGLTKMLVMNAQSRAATENGAMRMFVSNNNFIYIASLKQSFDVCVCL